MQDPLPENIDGQKTHSVEWQVDVGQVAMGAGLLALAWIAYRLFIVPDESGTRNAQDGDGSHQGVMST